MELSSLGDRPAYENKSLKVIISEDEMAGYIVSPESREFTVKEVEEELARHGVTFGVSKEAILKALREKPGTVCQVAWGLEPPLQERDKRNIPRFVRRFPNSSGKPQEVFAVNTYFRAAWNDLLSRGRVREGTILGFLRYPESSMWRVNVKGQKIPCFGGKRLLVPGENAVLSDDGMSIVARKKGIPYYIDDNTACVMDRVIIDGDISSLTQNVDFPGDLIIKGNIQRGFSVSSWGSVMVDGSVFGSVSAAGDLLVSGGINGLGQSIEVGGSVSARFIENSVVRAFGQVTVYEGILHSVIDCEDRVTLSQPGGRIVGGLVRAKHGVITDISGTHMGIPTLIEVGISPRERRELSRLKQDLEKISAEMDRLTMMMPRNHDASLRARDLDALRIQRGLKLLEERKKNVSERLTELEERLSKCSGGFFWCNKVYPGTRVFKGLNEIEMPRNPASVKIGDMEDETN